MTAHHRLLSKDRLRCACGWSVPWPAMGRWGEIWDAHIAAVESALPPGAPAGAVTPGSGVVPPAPVAYRHTYSMRPGHAAGPSGGTGLCSCGWEGVWHQDTFYCEDDWRKHAIAAYQQEEVAEQERDLADHDELLTINTTCVYVICAADCDALAGDEVAGSEVRE